MKKLSISFLIVLIVTASKAQLINPDFEIWDTDSSTMTTYANSWFPDITNHYCYQISPAQNGNYALGVSVWYYYVKTNAIQKTAITTRPSALEGYYSYTDNVVRSLAGDTISDTAMVHVLLTKFNTLTQQADTIGYGKLDLFASTSYSSFTCPVSYVSTATPDSITVIFDPSIVRRYVNVTNFQAMTSNGQCSNLTIDNLSLQSSSGINNQPANSEISLSPNPVKDVLKITNLKSDKCSLTVYNSQGKAVIQKLLNVAGGVSKVNFNDVKLCDGIYFVTIVDGERNFSKKLLKL